MKLPNLSEINTKYKKFSRDLKLEEKFSRLTDAVEKTCAEVSDALGLDEKMMKLSDTLDNFGKKHKNISETLRTEEYRPEPFADKNALDPVSRTGSAAEIYNKNKNIDEITPPKNYIPENVINMQRRVNNPKVRKNCITCKKYFVKGKNPV